jgi:hypothetical protein
VKAINSATYVYFMKKCLRIIYLFSSIFLYIFEADFREYVFEASYICSYNFTFKNLVLWKKTNKSKQSASFQL